MRSIISFYKEDTLGLAKIAHMATHYKVYSNGSSYEGSFSAGKLPSDESNSWIKLCMTPSAAGILACTSGEYAGGKIKIQNLCLSTPKICSMTLWADKWWRLKSSSLLAGLCIYKYQINYFEFFKKPHTTNWYNPTLQDGSTHLDMEAGADHKQQNLHLKSNIYPWVPQDHHWLIIP